MGKKADTGDIEGRISDILTRGVGMFVDPNGEFKKKLIAKANGEYKKDIIIKFGVDPTRPDIHLGHAVVLRKLRQLQDLGCKVVFLVGDFTAQIGDPTGKSKIRPEIQFAEVAHNMQTYLQQIDKILLLSRDETTKKITESHHFSWIRNSDWYISLTDILVPKESTPRFEVAKDGQKLFFPADPNSFVGKAIFYQENILKNTTSLIRRGITFQVSLRGVLSALRHVTFAQLIERDMFEERRKSNTPLFMNEMLYPVLQGLDSSLIERIYGSCDLEVGGTDQVFNMLMGRTIMENEEQKPQAVLSFKLLVGIDGKEKMSKSLDNYIGITDAPDDMFGKIMSIPDTAIPSYFELCAVTPIEEVVAMAKKIKAGKVNPRDIKMDLAQEIVEIYHGRVKAEEAKTAFVSTFQNKKLPEHIPEAKVAQGTLLVDALINADVIDSKNEFRRLMGEGAIRKDGKEKMTDPTMKITEDLVLKVGKHRFIRIVVA